MAVGERRRVSPNQARFDCIPVARNHSKMVNEQKLFEFPSYSCKLKRFRHNAILSTDFQKFELHSQRVHSSPMKKPLRIYRSSSNGTRLMDTRLSKTTSDNLDYYHVVVEETELEKATRERLMREVRQQNWIENEDRSDACERPVSSLSLPPRQKDSANLVEDNPWKRSSAISLTEAERHHRRGMHVDRGQFSKAFCDVLGPTLCADCTKSQMQLFDEDEHCRAFPNICVSPYALCVLQESEQDATRSMHNEWNPFAPSRNSRASPANTAKGSKTRPNSHIDERSSYRESTQSATFCNKSTLHFDPSGLEVRAATPCSSRCRSPRKSSISRYLESRNKELHELEDGRRHCNERNTDSQSPGQVQINPSVHFTGPSTNTQDNLDAENYLKNTAPSACSAPAILKRSRAVHKSAPVIEKTGKLSELPYWKFLIPEPPKMEVERMNVSMYTPKEIPGIKVFDEAFFDI